MWVRILAFILMRILNLNGSRMNLHSSRLSLHGSIVSHNRCSVGLRGRITFTVYIWLGSGSSFSPWCGSGSGIRHPEMMRIQVDPDLDPQHCSHQLIIFAAKHICLYRPRTPPSWFFKHKNLNYSLFTFWTHKTVQKLDCIIFNVLDNTSMFVGWIRK